MRLFPSCREVSKYLSEALDCDRLLGPHVRFHLLICAICRRVRAQFALIRHGATHFHDEGPSLTPEAKARLRRFLH